MGAGREPSGIMVALLSLARSSPSRCQEVETRATHPPPGRVAPADAPGQPPALSLQCGLSGQRGLDMVASWGPLPPLSFDCLPAWVRREDTGLHPGALGQQRRGAGPGSLRSRTRPPATAWMAVKARPGRWPQLTASFSWPWQCRGGGAGTVLRSGAWALCFLGHAGVASHHSCHPICLSAGRVSFPGLLTLPFPLPLPGPWPPNREGTHLHADIQRHTHLD